MYGRGCPLAVDDVTHLVKTPWEPFIHYPLHSSLRKAEYPNALTESRASRGTTRTDETRTDYDLPEKKKKKKKKKKKPMILEATIVLPPRWM